MHPGGDDEKGLLDDLREKGTTGLVSFALLKVLRVSIRKKKKKRHLSFEKITDFSVFFKHIDYFAGNPPPSDSPAYPPIHLSAPARICFLPPQAASRNALGILLTVLKTGACAWQVL